MHLRDRLLDEIIALSEKYEYYSGLIEHLRFKKWRNGNRLGTKEYKKLEEEIGRYEARLRAVNKGADYYYEMNLRTNQEAYPDKEALSDFLHTAIADMQKECEKTSSPMVAYYLKVLEFIWHHENGEHRAARAICLEMLGLVQNNVSVFRKERVGIACNNIAHCELLLRNYERAIALAKMAKKHLLPGSRNSFLSLELMFHANFYLGNTGKAHLLLRRLTSADNHDEIGYLLHDQYNCLLASLFFRDRDFQRAIDTLNKYHDVYKDKKGWKLSCKILLIQSLIESGRTEQASAQIESLRRVKEPTGRMEIIIKVLSHLHRKDFDLRRARVSGWLAQLQDGPHHLKWEPMTPEVLPFHEWLKGKPQRRMMRVAA
jgi:tetratricopeptide (TPR) repeat protein